MFSPPGVQLIMEIVDRNRLNQTEVLVRLSDGSERRLRLGAVRREQIGTFAADLQDVR